MIFSKDSLIFPTVFLLSVSQNSAHCHYFLPCACFEINVLFF